MRSAPGKKSARQEDHPAYAGRVQAIHARMEERGDVLCTSAFTLGEILVGPNKAGATEAADAIHLASAESAGCQSFPDQRSAVSRAGGTRHRFHRWNGQRYSGSAGVNWAGRRGAA